MPDPERALADAPEARRVVRRKTRLSLVWIVPIVAALVGAWVAYVRITSEGPEITIVLDTAEGLEAGKTKIAYNGVAVGTIETIRLSDDHRSVVATAQMVPRSEDFLVEGTKFWVVRPRISGATVSGLGTLISGAYVGMEIGHSKTRQREFVALTAPPVVAGDVPGRFFVLAARQLGSLDYGTPVYFRRLQVGEVVSYALDPNGTSLTVRIFVKAPYDRYVTARTRFWQAGGIDVSLTAAGLTVQTQSLLSILIGGIAFEAPEAGPEAAAETVFPLFDSHAEAIKPAAVDPHTFALVFTDSVRGLERGAPVDFRGVVVGEVTDVVPQLEVKTGRFSSRVTVRVDARLGVHLLGADRPIDEGERRKVLTVLVDRGFRAQLRSGSMLTGAMYVAFDLFPDAEPAAVDFSQDPPQVPTVPGTLEGIEATIGRIVKRLDAVPIDAIGRRVDAALGNLDRTLSSARGTLDSATGTLSNAGQLLAPDSRLDQQLGETLNELSRAARGLRVLADYLEQHPEALLRGKSGGSK